MANQNNPLTRGLLIPRIIEIMNILSDLHPPQKYIADEQYKEQDANAKWILGGTSPSGIQLGPIEEANYFIGANYRDLKGCAQRIVWIPPEVGEEKFAKGSSIGWHSPENEERSKLENRSFRRILSRIIPMSIQIWGNDYDDIDLLIPQIIVATEIASPGTIAHMEDSPNASSGGYVKSEQKHKGLVYELVLSLVFPIVAPHLNYHEKGTPVIHLQPTTEEDVSLRLQYRNDIRDQEINRGINQPHSLDTSPWKRKKFRNFDTEPKKEEGED